MMQLFMILVLYAMQLAAGFGVLCLFRLWLRPGMFWPLAFLCGTAVFSFVPFLLQLLHIPLTQISISIALALSIAALNFRFRAGLKHLPQLKPFRHLHFDWYKIPIFLVIAGIVIVSVWRCYYLPPFPRDLTSGAEVIAEYAAKEGSMINSVFSVDVSTTNNLFKPPFITALQLIYKLAGLPFGQIWLSGVFVSFLLFLYGALCRRIHPLLSGLLLVFFLAIPEMYAYTFMVLYDYSNAVFFCLSAFFLFEYFRNHQKNHLLFAGWMMGVATYIRSETLVLACLLMTVLLWHHIRRWESFTRMASRAFYFLWPAFFIYLVSVSLYLNGYLPVTYRVDALVNRHLLDLRPLFSRFYDMNTQLIFGVDGINYYGYFVFIFIIIILFDIVFSRRLAKTSKNWLFAVLVVYFGLPFLGYLLPLLDLDNSTKRGLFKIFPLMLLYIGNSQLLIDLSASIRKWEQTG